MNPILCAGGRGPSGDLEQSRALWDRVPVPGFRDGFEHYWVASEDELSQALASSLVVVDTNILLDLYRRADTLREDLFRILERIGDRLWVPHQVAEEFWRNRAVVLDDPSARLSEARRGLDKAFRTASDAIRTWERATVGDGVLDGRIDSLSDLLERIASEMAELRPTRVRSFATVEDPVATRLGVVLEGRVGEAPSASEWEARVAEARRRVAEQRPPGYLDAAKEESGRAEGAAGDYLVWCELIEESRRRGGRDVVFVTGDTKIDWWWRQGADVLGPRTELRVEFREATGHRVEFMDLPTLLSRSTVLDVDVAQESIEDASRTRQVETWTEAGLGELLRRLDEEGLVQADVVRSAAARGGWIDRDENYRVCGFEAGRTLRRFAAPVWRVTADLQSEGRVAADVAPALEATYVGVRADGYRVPPDVVEALVVSE